MRKIGEYKFRKLVYNQQLFIKLNYFQMKLFDLSFNKFGDEGGIHLKEIVNNVESLNLSWCKLTGVTVEIIATSLKNPVRFKV